MCNIYSSHLEKPSNDIHPICLMLDEVSNFCKIKDYVSLFALLLPLFISLIHKCSGHLHQSSPSFLLFLTFDNAFIPVLMWAFHPDLTCIMLRISS